MTWQVMGLGRTIHREQLETGLPDDLYRDFHALSEWVSTLPAKFGSRIRIRLVDAASIEGFVRSLLGRFRRYPAFTVEGRRYSGPDFTRVEALIGERLAAHERGS